MNDYRLESRLGAGGMAEVMRATMTSAGGFTRKVAIKRMLPHLCEDESAVRMFLDEARIASRLHHAAIVSVLDYGVLDGAPFQVLELVDGEDLRKIRARVGATHALFVPAILHVMHEVALALAYAHELEDERGPLGIVHRDVSPSNILIGWNGDVKLTDFGIAYAHDKAEKTRTGMMKGKLAYMAPEQALGGAVDARTDVFGMGCTLHAALTGASPTADEGAFAELLAGRPIEPSSTLDEDLRDIVRKSLAPSRSARFASMREWAQALAKAFAAREGRLGRDVLLEWLAGARTTPNPAPRGRGLDVLLGLELVPGEERDGVRTYTTKAAAPTKAPAEPPNLPQPPRARRWAPWLVVASGVGAAVGGIAWWSSTRDPEPAVVASRGAATVDPLVAPSPRPPPPAQTPTLEPSSSASTSALASAPPLPATPSSSALSVIHSQPSAPRTAASASAQAPTASSQSDAAPVAAAGTGYLVVAGERAHGYSVFVDGRPVGAAPTPAVPVTVGAHTVKLVKGSETLGPYSVSVSAENATPAKALRFRP